MYETFKFVDSLQKYETDVGTKNLLRNRYIYYMYIYSMYIYSGKSTMH